MKQRDMVSWAALSLSSLVLEKIGRHVVSHLIRSQAFPFLSQFFFLFEENQLTLYHGRIKSRNPSVRIQASVRQCDRSATINGINQKKLWVLGVIGKEVKIHNSQRTQVSLSNASTRSESAVREREKGTEHVFAHIKRPLITSCPPCLA